MDWDITSLFIQHYYYRASRDSLFLALTYSRRQRHSLPLSYSLRVLISSSQPPPCIKGQHRGMQNHHCDATISILQSPATSSHLNRGDVDGGDVDGGDVVKFGAAGVSVRWWMRWRTVRWREREREGRQRRRRTKKGVTTSIKMQSYIELKKEKETLWD